MRASHAQGKNANNYNSSPQIHAHLTLASILLKKAKEFTPLKKYLLNNCHELNKQQALLVSGNVFSQVQAHVELSLPLSHPSLPFLLLL